MPATRTLLTLAALGTVVLAGCKNPVDIRQQIVYDVQSANYALAVPKVNDLYDCALTGDLAAPGDAKLVDKDDIDEKEELLWRMERGAIDLLRTDPPSALRHLDRASQLVVERRTESLTRAVGTYLANDTASEYAGNGYEHVQVDFQRALANVLAAQQQQGIMAKTGAETAELDTAVQAMNNIARGMVLEKIQFNQDNAPDLRYFDAPFARIFAAAVYLATPLDQRSRDDEGFAMAQVTKALKAYVEQKKVLGGDGSFRYEVDGIPPAVLRLAALIGRSYDAEGFNTLLGQVGIAANDPRLGAPLAKDQGLVLLLNQADWITPTDVLTIDLKVNVPYVPSISEAERARGVTVTGFMTFGGTTFYAKGPNSRAAESWGGAIATLGEVAKFFGVAAPGTWIGFEMPTHRADEAVAAPAELVVDETAQPAAVITDLDAYARATLKDRQPSVLAKTLTRVFAKHIAAEIAATAAREATKGKSAGEQVFGLLLGIGAHAAASASESADTRHWALLCDRIEASLATVTAGKHQISVRSPAGSVQVGEITVPAGRLVIVPTRTFPHPVPSPYPAGK